MIIGTKALFLVPKILNYQSIIVITSYVACCRLIHCVCTVCTALARPVFTWNLFLSVPSHWTLAMCSCWTRDSGYSCGMANGPRTHSNPKPGTPPSTAQFKHYIECYRHTDGLRVRRNNTGKLCWVLNYQD